MSKLLLLGVLVLLVILLLSECTITGTIELIPVTPERTERTDGDVR